MSELVKQVVNNINPEISGAVVICIIGILGIPVFTGKGGIQVILNGPTGGILIGYLFSALIVGLLTKLLLSTLIYKYSFFILKYFLLITVSYKYAIIF